jgi:hypothetical protein
VYWPIRWRLLWAARSDRRSGLPVGLSCDTTPVLRGLVARRDDVCERERTQFLIDVGRIDVRRAEIAEELQATERLIRDRTEGCLRLSSRPTDAQLSVRRAGEQSLSVELVQQRRTTEWQRLVDQARVDLDVVRERHDVLLAEMAELEARRQHRAHVAQSRAIRFSEHTDRLAAIYRRALVRRHPQREGLIGEWQTPLSPLPLWVSSDDLAPTSQGVAA